MCYPVDYTLLFLFIFWLACCFILCNLMDLTCLYLCVAFMSLELHFTMLFLAVFLNGEALFLKKINK